MVPLARAARIAALAVAVACADALPFGPHFSLTIVPVFSETSSTLLVGDLDQLRVRVAPPRSNLAVLDTIVAVDAEGNADLKLSVPLRAEVEDFEVLLEGIRSTPAPATVLYSGLANVRVASDERAPAVGVPVVYIGPCQATSGCRVTAGPQGAQLAQGDSVLVTLTVLDAAGAPVPLVPVSLEAVDTALLRLGAGGYAVARAGTTGGSARVAAVIRSDVDTLFLTIAPPAVPAPGRASGQESRRRPS